MSQWQHWFSSPRGQFFHARQLQLLERMLAAWPRRGRSLVEIGCGPGVFLDVFWQAGFDVSGVDAQPAMLAAARERLGDRVELHQAAYDHLPFADREFDFVVFSAASPSREHLAEAVRIASRGVLVMSCNALSFAGMARHLPTAASTFPPTAPACGLTLLRRLRGLGKGRLAQRAVLLGPPISWVERAPWNMLNSWPCLLPFGAWQVIRLDLDPFVGMTPLVQRAKDKLAPVLRTSSCATFSHKTPAARDSTPHGF
ncbi:class I SAM-dependent methyltransferase [Megalodesulfovibrio paquesii]